ICLCPLTRREFVGALLPIPHGTMHGDGRSHVRDSLARELNSNSMTTFISRLAGRAGDLAQTQPLLALCLGAALFALFISLLLRKPATVGANTSFVWTLYSQASRFLFAAILVLLLAQTLGVLRTYLRKSVAQFQQTHGRITTANYNAVETIWGSEQTQRELTFQVYYDEE